MIGCICWLPVMTFRHAVHCSVVLVPSYSYRRSVVPSFCHTVVLSYRRSVIPSFCHTVVLSYRRSVIPSFCHTVVLSYRRTAQIKHIWFGRKKEIDDILMEVISENRNVKKSESSNSTEHSCGRPAKDCDSKDNKSDSDSEFEAVSVSYWRVVD